MMTLHRLFFRHWFCSLPLLLCLLTVLSAQARNDAPARVGRIAFTEGQVEIRNLSGETARTAQLNWPVVSGNTISTLDFSRAEIQIGSTALRLEAESELEIRALSDSRMVLRLHAGSVHVKVANPQVAPQFELLTSQGRMLMQAPSQVRVDFASHPDTTSVRLIDGAVRFESRGADMVLQPGQQWTLRQNQMVTSQFTRDDFDNWSLARDLPATRSTQYVSTEITGYQELDRHGDWKVSKEYGALWYPRETPGDWAPYRYGSWTWVAPWGWTWVDQAAWGYAPSHYGRWVWHRQRWAWAPGPRVEHPRWSPAMVGWVHHHGGSGSHAHVGWYPLRPGEYGNPGHHHSSDDYRYVNGRWVGPGGTRHGRNGHHWHDHHGALTSLPQSQFTDHTVVPVHPGKPPVIQPPPRRTVYEPPKPLNKMFVGPIPSGQVTPGTAPPAPVGITPVPRPGRRDTPENDNPRWNDNANRQGAGEVRVQPSVRDEPFVPATSMPRRNTVYEAPRPERIAPVLTPPAPVHTVQPVQPVQPTQPVQPVRPVQAEIVTPEPPRPTPPPRNTVREAPNPRHAPPLHSQTPPAVSTAPAAPPAPPAVATPPARPVVTRPETRPAAVQPAPAEAKPAPASPAPRPNSRRDDARQPQDEGPERR